MKCTIPNCTEWAVGDSVPPLCPVHLDLDCLVEFVLSRKEPLTLDAVQKHFEMAASNSAMWVVTKEQIAETLPGFLAARGLELVETKKEPAVPTTRTTGQLTTPAGAGANQ